MTLGDRTVADLCCPVDTATPSTGLGYISSYPEMHLGARARDTAPGDAASKRRRATTKALPDPRITAALVEGLLSVNDVRTLAALEPLVREFILQQLDRTVRLRESLGERERARLREDWNRPHGGHAKRWTLWRELRHRLGR